MTEAMRWFRMHAEILYDPKVMTMPEAMRWRLVALMCLKCEGKFPAPDDQVSWSLDISIDELNESLALFKSRGFLTPSGDFRNWDKRQYRSDVSTERVRKHRETFQKRSSSVPETPSETDTDTDTEQKQTGRAARKRATTIPDDFELSEEMRSYALAKLPDMDTAATFDDFKAFHLHKGTTGRDWVRGWQTWVNNCVKGFKYAKAKRREQRGGNEQEIINPWEWAERQRLAALARRKQQNGSDPAHGGMEPGTPADVGGDGSQVKAADTGRA